MYMKDWHMVYIGDLPKRAMAVPKKSGERFVFSTVYHPSGRKKLQIGNIYTIQEPKSKKPIFGIKVTNIRQMVAKNVTDKIANKLGYRDADHWRKKWNAYFAGKDKIENGTEIFLVDFVLE